MLPTDDQTIICALAHKIRSWIKLIKILILVTCLFKCVLKTKREFQAVYKSQENSPASKSIPF